MADPVLPIYRQFPIFGNTEMDSDLLLQILLDNRVLFPTPLCRQVFVCDHHFAFPPFPA
jgi:hypothetical protein